MSFSESIGSKSEKPVSVISWCELSSQHDSYTFHVPEECHYEQQLALRTICLGETAPDEFHVVEVVPTEEGDAQAPVPLATLKPSVLPTVTPVGLELTPPVTFHLRAGSGPVYISAQHVYMVPNPSEEEEEEEEEEEGPVEESPEKSPKGQAAQNGNAAKGGRVPGSGVSPAVSTFSRPQKRRLEKEDELNTVSPEDPLPSKGRGAGRCRKAAEKK
ncbi:nucleoplasmin-2 [Aegotheles albertisi]